MLVQHPYFLGKDPETQRGKGLLWLILLVSSDAVMKKLNILIWNKHSCFGLAGEFE